MFLVVVVRSHIDGKVGWPGLAAPEMHPVSAEPSACSFASEVFVHW
jgi:hypothetical protein